MQVRAGMVELCYGESDYYSIDNNYYLNNSLDKPIYLENIFKS